MGTGRVPCVSFCSPQTAPCSAVASSVPNGYTGCRVGEGSRLMPLLLRAWEQLRHLAPVGVAGLVSWSVWLFRRTLSAYYRPVPAGYTTTTSVVVPSYREDPDILDRCLWSWLAEGPTEVIVVPDLADTEVIAR